MALLHPSQVRAVKPRPNRPSKSSSSGLASCIVATINFIRSLDAERDIALLKYYGWDVSPVSAHTLRLSTMLLQKGVERGLTPFAIGSIMCRETINDESVIESIICEAQESSLPGTSGATSLDVLSQIMDSTLDKLGK